MAELVPGSRLGPYEIVGTLGTGGMGQVFRARDTRLERDVAIKVLSPTLLTDDAARARVHKEAVVLAKLKHRNIAHLYDVLAVSGTEALVMELVEGPTLAERLREGTLPEAEAVRLGIQLADGLAAAHAEGIVHCDLKPANVKLPPGGDLRILDFGIAKLRRAPEGGGNSVLETLTSTGAMVAGTLPYMAPEQLRADPVDARTDVWAAGVVLCEMATGTRPFDEAVPAKLTDAILHASPAALSRPAPGVSPGLLGILRRCLQKDPDDRYQSAAQLRTDLEAIRADPTRHPTAFSTLGAAPRNRRRIGVAAALSIAALLALLVAANVGGVRTRLFGGGAGARIDSLAVLPLSNLSKDPEQEYFADGMTEAVIAELSRLKALKVISRTSAMKYKNAKETLPEIAKALGVKGVVEGSVMRDGKTVRITVQLIDAATDRHLWAESYTREDRNVLALQSEVASAIAREVRVAVSPEEAGHFAAARPVDPEAHRLVLLGTYAIDQSLTQRAGIEKGTELFRKAIDTDPKFALAHLRLAMALRWGGFAGYRPMGEACAESRAEVEKAIALDPAGGEAFSLLASLRRSCDLDWAGAERDVRRALEALSGLGFRPQRGGLSHVHPRPARGGGPGEPRGRAAGPALGGDRRLLRDAAGLRPPVRGVHPAVPKGARRPPGIGLREVPARQFPLGVRRYDEAIAVFLSRKVPDPGSNFAVGLAYGLAGRKDDARRVLNTLLEKRKSAYLPPTQIAIIYAGLGEKETAWAWMEQAWNDRAWLIDEMAVDPLFDAFRGDPRFADLVRKMNLPGLP